MAKNGLDVVKNDITYIKNSLGRIENSLSGENGLIERTAKNETEIKSVWRIGAVIATILGLALSAMAYWR